MTGGATVLFDEIDLLAQTSGEVSAGVPGERPADRLRRRAQVAEVLLRLVAVLPADLDLGEATIRPRPQTDAHGDGLALKGVQDGAGFVPFLGAVPAEKPLEGVGIAVAVGVAQPRQQSPGNLPPDRLHQLSSQDAQGVGIVQKHPVVVEGDGSLFRPEIEQFEQLELLRLHIALQSPPRPRIPLL